MNNTRNLAALTALTLAAFTACSSGSKSPGSATPSNKQSSISAASQAAPTKAPIVVGVIADESAGPEGASQDVPKLMSAWQSYVNGHGGIQGHPVRYINEDDRQDPATAATAVQTLVGDHVVAIMDNSAINPTWAKAADSAHIPVISLNESASGLTYEADPNFFADGTTVLGVLWGQTAIAAAVGKKVFGGVYCSELPQCKQAVAVWQADAPKLGMKFGLALAASFSAPNYTAQCLEMKQAGVDALFPIPQPKVEADNCAQQGYHPQYIGSQGTLAFSFAKDANLNGALQNETGFPWMLDNTPALQEFHAAEDGVLASADNPAGISAGWTGLKLLEKALTNVSATPSAQDVYNGLYSLHAETLGGLSATPLTFTQGRPDSQRCYFVVKIDHGQWVAPYGMTPQCEPQNFISATG